MVAQEKSQQSVEPQKEKAPEGDLSEPQYWTEPQKEEASEVDHLELHYAVQPQKTKAINAFGTNPQTSDDQVKPNHQIPSSSQASSSCLQHSHVRAGATVYSHV